MNIEFQHPWAAIGKHGSNLEAELCREISMNHPLWGACVEAIGRRVDSDDVLFVVKRQTGDTEYAVTHLTWSDRTESESYFPHTTFYSSIKDWIARRMRPDCDATASQQKRIDRSLPDDLEPEKKSDI